MAVEGEVLYEIRGDDSYLESDLEEAQKKVEKSAKETSEKQESIEENTAKVLKQKKRDVTDYHKEKNDETIKDDEETGEKREENERKVGENIKNIAGNTAKAIGAAMVAVGTAAASAGAAAVGSAVSMDQAMNQFISSTGKGTEEADRYQNVLEEIYKNNYGESFNDIGQAMAEVTKQLGDMSDEKLQEITESAFVLRDTFEYEIPESTRAAKAMMDSFGTSGKEAMSLIAAGAQNGLDYSGELLDSISEYSVQFAKMGLDADDMFKIFEKGAETGAWNLDKIGDAVKEMSIRVIDGSDTTREGFEALGLDADEMAAKFAAGGNSAKEAFMQTISALAGMEDPLAQNLAGVNLLGTMWEDLGPEVVSQLASIEDGAYDTADAMNSIKEVKYEDLGSMLDGLKRSVEMLLLPLGEQLIPILDELIEASLPLLEEALPPIIDVFGELISQMAPLLESVLPVLLELIDALVPPLTALMESILPILLSVLEAMLPILTSMLEFLSPILELILEFLDPLLELLDMVLTPLLELLTFFVEEQLGTTTEALEKLLAIFVYVFDEILKSVRARIQLVTKILGELVDFIKNVFTGNWKGAWENVKEIFRTIAEAISESFKKPINFIIDQINNFIDGLNRIKIPDWIPVVGGKGFSIPKIPKLRVGMDFVPEDDFPALLHRGEAVLTAEENAALRSIGGMSAVYAALNTPNIERANSVLVENMATGESINYERLGTAVADALVDGNVRLVVGEREFARLEKELG